MQLENRLEQAVARQLVADVPVGVLLSGGVDSSLITAMAVRSNPEVRTYTVSFPGHGAHDETAHARRIAAHFGTHHTELRAEESTVDLLPELARQCDEPIMDSSLIPTFLVSRCVRQHCTVALGGDGGDELFGGYMHYSRILRLAQLVDWCPHWIRGRLAQSADAMLPTGTPIKNWIRAAGVSFDVDVPAIATYFDARERRRLIARDGWQLVAEGIRQSRLPRQGGLLERAMQLDFGNYLPDDILVKVDRASMLASLEVRAPLLDVQVLEFAHGCVPPRFKATANGRKLLLRRLAARVLPTGFDAARKQGFSIPLATWLKSPSWWSFFRDVLQGSQGLFDRRALEALFESQQRGRANAERLFGLVMLELWRKEYGLSV